MPQPSKKAENRVRLVLAGVVVLGLACLLLLNRAMNAPTGEAQARTPATEAATGADPRSRPPGVIGYTKDPDGASNLVTKLARQSGGDFNKLTDGEQRMLNAMAGGHGADLLRVRAQQQASPAPSGKK